MDYSNIINFLPNYGNNEEFWKYKNRDNIICDTSPKKNVMILEAYDLCYYQIPKAKSDIERDILYGKYFTLDRLLHLECKYYKCEAITKEIVSDIKPGHLIRIIRKNKLVYVNSAKRLIFINKFGDLPIPLCCLVKYLGWNEVKKIYGLDFDLEGRLDYHGYNMLPMEEIPPLEANNPLGPRGIGIISITGKPLISTP